MANLSAIPLPGREREAGIERRKEGGRRTNFAEQSFPNYTGNRGRKGDGGTGRRKKKNSSIRLASSPPTKPGYSQKTSAVYEKVSGGEGGRGGEEVNKFPTQRWFSFLPEERKGRVVAAGGLIKKLLAALLRSSLAQTPAA